MKRDGRSLRRHPRTLSGRIAPARWLGRWWCRHTGTSAPALVSRRSTPRRIDAQASLRMPRVLESSGRSVTDAVTTTCLSCGFTTRSRVYRPAQTLPRMLRRSGCHGCPAGICCAAGVNDSSRVCADGERVNGSARSPSLVGPWPGLWIAPASDLIVKPRCGFARCKCPRRPDSDRARARAFPGLTAPAAAKSEQPAAARRYTRAR